MRLSIIIPAYNVEQYLERCVESCENQDISNTDYEIIIVNDGSPDNSLQIAERLALKYSNIVVISQENQGLSGARNTGIDNARGKYLWFVDSDDYLVENCIGRVLGICEDNELDICHFSLNVMDENLAVKKFTHSTPNEVLVRGRDVILKNVSDVVCSACSNFYNRKFLKDHNLYFTLGLTQQDTEFNGRVFGLAERCMFVDDSMYVYFYNSESIRRSPKLEKQIKYACDTIRIAALRRDFYSTQCDDRELREYFLKYTNSLVAGTLFANINTTEKRILEEMLKAAKASDVYPIKGKTLSWKWDFLLPFINNQHLWPLLRLFR